MSERKRNFSPITASDKKIILKISNIFLRLFFLSSLFLTKNSFFVQTLTNKFIINICLKANIMFDLHSSWHYVILYKFQNVAHNSTVLSLEISSSFDCHTYLSHILFLKGLCIQVHGNALSKKTAFYGLPKFAMKNNLTF